MKQKKKIVTIIIWTILLLLLAYINQKYAIIMIPSDEDLISRNIDLITISTVFAGFSFTALGLLLGLSSETLIEKIKNTNIIMNKVGRIINSIIFFILSVAISLIFVLGTNPSQILSCDEGVVLDRILYVLCIGYLIAGIIYFSCSVYELYDLVKRIYGYNKKEVQQKIEVAESQMNRTRKLLRENEGCGK